MVDILGAEIPTPTFSLGSNTGFWITIVSAIIIFTIAICIGVWLFVMSRTYNKKIVLFENISGARFEPTFKDTARVVKIGEGGEEILFLRKMKVYRTAYGKKMGKNTYWFAVGQDGYWYNFLLGDLDAKMGMLDIEPIDRDMRYMHVAIRKNIQDRYRKKKMEKIVAITVVGIVITVLIMMVGNWFILGKLGDLLKESTAAQSAFAPTAEAIKNIAAHLDNVCGGSGIKTE